jgi:hypothetical protein
MGQVLKLGKKMKSIDVGKVKCADCINGGGTCIHGKDFPYEPYKPRDCDYYMFYD